MIGRVRKESLLADVPVLLKERLDVAFVCLNVDRDAFVVVEKSFVELAKVTELRVGHLSTIPARRGARVDKEVFVDERDRAVVDAVVRTALVLHPLLHPRDVFSVRLELIQQHSTKQLNAFSPLYRLSVCIAS